MNEFNPYDLASSSPLGEGAPGSVSAPSSGQLPSPWPIIFDRGSVGGTGAYLLIGLGSAAIGFALLMFVLHVFLIDAGQFAFHTATTVPMIGGVFMINGGLHILKIPCFIRIWPDGMEISGRTPNDPTAALRWEQIRRMTSEDTAMGMGKKITLLDGNDHTIGEVRGPIGDFDRLVTLIKQNVETSSGTQSHGDTSKRPRKRAWGRAIGLGTVGSCMLAGGLFMVIDGRWKSYRDAKFANERVTGTGTVVERKIAPNGRTKRVYVKVVAENGSEETHNFETTDAFYQSVAVGDEVSIQTVASDPEIAELSSGQVRKENFTDTATGAYLMALVAFLFSGLMLGVAVVSWMGYDLRIDNGSFRLAPIGEA